MEFFKATDNDVNEIYSILKACADNMASEGLYHWIPYYPQERILEDISNKSVYLVKDGKENIGTFTLMDIDNNGTYLSKLAILPDKSGHGKGTECLKYIENQCCLNKRKKIVLDVYDKSDKAIRFYEKNAFKIIGEKPTRRFKVYIMEKELI